jgi:1-deoxy-D-xylulose-5-phosphate synthase
MDEPSLRAALEFMRTYDEGLSVVRYPRDSVSDRFTDQDCPPFELGKARALLTHETPDVAILGYGTCAIDAMTAVDQLNGEYKVNVYDARYAKPVDVDLLRDLIARDIPIITVEDHSLEGGFGSCVVDACQAANLDTRRITTMGIPATHWIYQGSRSQQLEEAGIDAPSIARTVRAVLDSTNGHTPGDRNHPREDPDPRPVVGLSRATFATTSQHSTAAA